MCTKRLITRLVFTSLIVASLFFSGLGITPVHAASIIVNTDADETTTNGLCSLREAIINANNDAATYPDCAVGLGADTITFAGNYIITLAGAQLPAVTSTIIINGKGAANTIIQANANPNIATYRVFHVAGGNLTIDSLTVRHGNCSVFTCLSGGGIFNGSAGSTLTVANSVISGNTAWSGGGITNSIGASLTVLNSTISGNEAEWGGGLYNNNSTAITTNSTFSGNSAIIGGGIFNGGVDGNNYILTITNSTFSGNSAGSGGGIYNNNTGLSIANSTISGNNAGDGGGIYSHFTANVNITNSTISANNANNKGGGIYNISPSNLGITDTTLYGNSSSNGGGISNEGSMQVVKSTLSSNSAYEGGAIYNSSNGNMSLANSTISGNTAEDYGGGIYSDGSASIYNSTIVFNTLWVGTPLGAGGIDGDVALYNSIVAGNTRAISSTYRDCNGTILSYGHNLFSDTTNCNIIITFTSGSWDFLNSINLLGPLQNNGGATQTHALLLGSNAIDTGDNINFYCASSPVSNIDQRGVTRPQGTSCDVGAFEWKNEAPTDVLLSASTISENLPAGTVVGTLTAIDSNLGDTHTYSFCGGVNDASFSIAGNTLNTTAVFDFETQSTFNICIRATDAATTAFDKAFEVLVLDAAEDPAPETTVIDMKVRKPRGISNYMFLFTSSDLDSTFMCRLDAETFSPCKNAITHSGLSAGLHTFQVYAIDPSGNPDLTPAEYPFIASP